ncbi:PepSY-associated TM helix domain-containing protein [Pontibacter actiniarum]|uniref:Peptidase M4 n=1 Tax=Pontibacter actiniarum TaxID=323450 RepID=A0A1X9YMC9_9BACT|nr:PepSY-associated TM helix domain-containing protein [Pontibacter actiniarum]ARS34036.1 peptidase M4 [Pontibacter actiniarum]
MSIKKLIGKVHLWLGFASGLLVLFLGITGCILSFQREIEDATQEYRFVEHQPGKALLPPSELRAIADSQLPGKKTHSVSYQKGKAALVVYYDFEPEYYYTVYLNPYTGDVLKVKNMAHDFFRIIIEGHYYLWLPPNIGQPILASATLIFVVLLITGIILWWPKNKSAAKQRFSIKWSAKWRRKNYDLHNVLGFYMSWVVIFIAITGLVWGFQWVSKSVYWATSGGKPINEYYETLSDTTKASPLASTPAIDLLWDKVRKENPAFTGSLEVHIPENKKTSIEIASNPDTDTYWKIDYRYFDQHTLQELPVTHMYGKLADASVADKIRRMNYDIHVGAIGGIVGKIIAFFASLLAASMPVTGTLIWWGRRKKAARKVAKPEPQQQARRLQRPRAVKA